jgi:hypothetical protein
MKGTISKLLGEILRNPNSREELMEALIDRTKTINHNGKIYKIKNFWEGRLRG